MNNFFPTEDYKMPVTGNYMKLQDGDNTFRVLSSAIVGWEYWNNQSKPVRSKTPFNGTPADIGVDKDGKTKRINHFWAFVVWNYQAEKIQILELTQKGVMSDIESLVKNNKWGNPKKYDITIKRSGTGFETQYTVMPNPHSEPSPSILEAYSKMKINLDALYTGDDPFKN